MRMSSPGEFMTDEEEPDVLYDVVRNDEDQYSIWRVGREIPDGWSATGFRATKADCLAHIDEVWTDMRPRSLRERMERAQA
jgi:MbtH protein